MERFEKELEVARRGNTKYLLRGIANTIRNNYEELVIDDLIFINTNKVDAIDFKNQLKEAGISEFIFKDTSTSLMEIIHCLDEVGIKIKGLASFDRIFFGYNDTIKGLRMIVE